MSPVLLHSTLDGFKRESFKLLSELLQAVRARNNNFPFLDYFSQIFVLKKMKGDVH